MEGIEQYYTTILLSVISILWLAVKFLSKDKLKNVDEKFKSINDGIKSIGNGVKTLTNDFQKFQIENMKECSDHRNKMYESFYKKDYVNKQEEAIDNRLDRLEAAANGKLKQYK